MGLACRVQRQGLAARVQGKQWCSPLRAGNGSLGKPAGGEQIFSQRMLGTKLTQGAPCGGWTCGMLGGRGEPAPAGGEERVSSWGWQSDRRARGLGPGFGPGAKAPRARAPSLGGLARLSMPVCMLEESAPSADTAGMFWLGEGPGPSSAQ